MTDTTDTASLKKQIETAADIIRDLTDKLEAERQRAQELEQICKNEYQNRKKMDAEIEALKGDQVPVAWTDAEELRDMTTDGCAYLFKVDPANPFTDPRRQIMLYDRPQKPVVTLGHIKISEVVAAVSLEQNRKWNGRVGYMAGWNACIDAAIAGGIVKDGE